MARRGAAAGPSLLGTAVFYLLPFLEVIRRSFTDAAGRRFLGLANYQTVLTNRAFAHRCREYSPVPLRLYPDAAGC